MIQSMSSTIYIYIVHINDNIFTMVMDTIRSFNAKSNNKCSNTVHIYSIIVSYMLIIT